MIIRADLVGTLGELPVVVGAVHHLRKVLLLDVVDADGSFAGILRLGQGGQQQGGKDGDDGDHHQQFNQRECAFGFGVHIDVSAFIFPTQNMPFPNSTLGEFASKRIPPRYRGGLPMYHSSFQYILPLLAWDACPSAHMMFPISPCR